MLDHAIGPNVVRGLIDGMEAFLERNADRGWTRLEDFRGLRREAVVPQWRIARPPDKGYDPDDTGEGYAREAITPVIDSRFTS
jgi:hypothetical protein